MTEASVSAPAGLLSAASGRTMAALAVGLSLLTVGAAQFSTIAFVLSAIALLGLLGVAALRWPRVMLVVLVLSPPIVDLYAGQRLLPDQAQPVARFFSEALLLVMAIALSWIGLRKGTLASAIRHPFTVAVGVFLVVGAISALVNAVPPHVAAAGMIFTLDAAILFLLPRIVGYSHREARQTMWAIAAVVGVTSLFAIGQAILSPDLLGVTPISGRSGEGVRFGSLVRDPNILGTLIGMVLPFSVYSLVRLPRGRGRWVAAGMAFAMTLALLLTYSRGSWLGVAVGFGVIALIIDRRALLAFAAIVLLAYATAVVMPKGILAGDSQNYDPFATTINRFDAVGEGRDLRTLFVRNALPIFEEHPALGVGPGRYGGAAASIFGSPVHEAYGTGELLTNQKTVDNFWLHLGIEGGIVGAAAFLAMIGTALLGPIRALRGAVGSRFAVPAGILSGALVLCVATVTTMLLEGNTVAFLFWFLLGIGSLSARATARTGGPAESATPSGG